MSKFFYAPEGGEGSGGGASSSTSTPAGGAGSNAGAGTQGSGTLLSGSPSSGAGGAGNGAPGVGGTQPNAGTGGAPVVQKSWREGWIGSDGKIDKSAYDRLPDHLKPFSETLKKYDTDEALLGAFLHSQTLNGKKGLQPLDKNASEKDKAEWNGRLRELLGVPKDAAGYGVLEKPADVPDTLWNGEYVQTMAGIMHKYNAPPEMVKELFAADRKFGTDTMGKGQSQAVEARKAADALITQTFGQNRDAEIHAARRAAETVGIDVQDPDIGNNPKIIIALSKMAKLLGEDKLVRPGSAEGAVGGGDDRARARDIVMNMANPLNEAYHDSSHGGHAQAVAQYQALIMNHARRTGGKAA